MIIINIRKNDYNNLRKEISEIIDTPISKIKLKSFKIHYSDNDNKIISIDIVGFGSLNLKDLSTAQTTKLIHLCYDYGYEIVMMRRKVGFIITDKSYLR